ncbi:MAG TPA: RNase adapter RapZ [Candidatus Saccharimonadales bacterium]|nr:RNase adapter RapZ [Candidatus Saccharimonadales bacterium]
MNVRAVPAQYVIITGLSGAGKSFAANCFEDMGYYCIDNLPLRLIPVLSDLISRSTSKPTRVALVVDIREGSFLRDFPETIGQLRREGREVRIVFLDSSEEVLLRRFSETRRPHPLSRDGSVEEGIRREKEILRPILEQADRVIDTSRFNVHELRDYLFETFSESSRQDALFVSVISFGYKYGLPMESDMIFDVRFLPNPNFEPGLREKSGLDGEVEAWLVEKEDYQAYYSRVSSLLSFLMPRFVREGKAYVTVAFGCTGGRHRSVLIARKLGEELSGSGYHVRTVHRDLSRG